MSQFRFEERTQVLNEHHHTGEYVIYWMRTAVRTDHNPALIRALDIAARDKLPFFIYHAVSEKYPFASRRHHTFIFEGAQDVAKQCEERGITYYFHMERAGHRGPFLKTLAQKARAVVTEDMPIPFLQFWTERLAFETGVSFHLVDTSCLVPMQASTKAPTRAFRFREQFKGLRDQNIQSISFPDLSTIEITAPTHLSLPFTPVDFAKDDLQTLLNDCEIDHSVLPVPDTPGGMNAAQTRWADFKSKGLRQYHKRRNDPNQHGVSRMSAYFHYGMISTFQVAKDASGCGAGGEKYLDELLIWRELTYHWCKHIGKPQHWSALPQWAQDTLSTHASNCREHTYSWQTLRYAETNDELWNACQRSLNRHGELHNNLRMTWGKQLIPWVQNPKKALRMALDLNNRFALDGRDPASYGGILWCFGLFDRPFPPEKPIWGTVRSRDTAGHDGRLNKLAYIGHIDRLQHEPVYISAQCTGFVGAMLHRTLAQYGFTVCLPPTTTLTLPKVLNPNSTIEKLTLQSWQDAGWVQVDDTTLSWTADGISFWTTQFDLAKKSTLNSNHIILQPDAVSDNPIHTYQQLLKQIASKVIPPKTSRAEQLTLW